MLSTDQETNITRIGLGEYAISNTPGHIIMAPNLGSCLAVSAYDPKTGWGAMAHHVLPTSSTNPEKALTLPCNFVDSGFVFLLGELLKRGVNKKDLVICCAGASNIADVNNVFEIGKRNHTIFRKLMWKNGLLIKGEHVGDGISRTVTLEIGSGIVSVRIQKEVIRLA